MPLTSFFPGDLQLLILELADEMGIFEVCGQADLRKGRRSNKGPA